MRLLGNVWFVIIAFLGSAAAVLVWLRAPLLICHVPLAKDQAELGVFELKVSWKRTGEELVGALKS
jgi:hypothetical protein